MWNNKKQEEQKQQALRPEMFTIPAMLQQPKDIEELTVEEQIVAAGYETRFWKILKGHFDREMEKLEQLQENAMISGLSEQEIGRNTIIISLTKGVLQRVMSVVKDAKEAEDERLSQQQTEGARP